MTESSTVTVQEEVDVLDAQGNNLPKSSLSSIFDKIESGKEEGLSTADVISEAKKPKEEVAPPKPEVKPEAVKKDEPKAEVKEPEKKEEVEVSDREKLMSLTSEKKEEKAEAKNEQAEDEVPEAELQVMPHDKPKTAKRIKALLSKIDAVNSEVTRTRAEASEKAAKLAELEAKLSEVKTVNPETDEKIKAQLDELTMYRRRYDLDKDPEVKTKFDSRIETAEASIIESLVKRNAGEGLIKVIKDEGGWSAFAQSGRVISVPDGEGGTVGVTCAELSERVLQALPLGERKAVEAAMVEQIQTKRDKERYFKEQQENASQFFKKREEETQRQTAEHQKLVAENAKFLDEWYKKATAADWVKDKEIPANATAKEKAEIEEYNKYNVQLRGLLDNSRKVKDLPKMMEIVGDSVRYYDERRTSNTLRKEIDKLKADLAAKQNEIDRFKKASSSVPRSGSIATTVSTSSESNAPKRPSSISDAFDRLERGEGLNGNRDEE